MDVDAERSASPDMKQPENNDENAQEEQSAGVRSPDIEAWDAESDGKKSGAESPNVATQKPWDLAGNVTAFLEKLAPWKPLMPSDLRKEMEAVLSSAQRARGPTILPEKVPRSIPSPPPPPFESESGSESESESLLSLDFEWDYEIKKQTMETWKRSHPYKLSTPTPVILTYYRTLGPASSLGTLPADFSHTLTGKTSDIVVEQQNLQRIWVISYILHDELELLTSATNPWPLIIAPPYKLLLEFLPHLRKRLIEVQDELAEAILLEEEEEKKLQQEKNASLDVKTTNSVRDGDMASSRADTQHDIPSPGVRHVSRRTRGHRYARKIRVDTPQAAEQRRRDNLKMRIAHLECLLSFIDSNLGNMIKMRAQIADGTLQQIAFEDLWHLFRPGDLILSKPLGKKHWQLSKVYSVTGGQITRRSHPDSEGRIQDSDYDDAATTVGTWTAFRIDSYMMVYDGHWVGPDNLVMRIKHYTGRKRITELPFFPVRFHPDKDRVLATLEERGRKFMNCFGHQFYEGLTVPLASSNNNDSVVISTRHRERRPFSPPPRRRMREHKLREHREDIVSEVYVDIEAYYQKFPVQKPRLGKLHRSRQNVTETSEIQFVDDRPDLVQHYGHEVDSMLSEHFRSHNRTLLEPFDPDREKKMMTAEVYQLLTHHVPAYAFRYRQWYLLDIECLRPIDENRYSGFKDLVIPDHYKELLVALVDNHTSGLERRADKQQQQKRMEGFDNAQIDLVPGKGQGLIILLHGPPGSGKTSTAETIAAYTRRPLYSITCGDIGLEPADVEEQLEEHTSIADKWGCVLLLDEADVFLMQRTWKEINRNALVSVFLRQLEYYSGILFLTTNRPGTIDEAFKSRIHVSLRYPSIDLPSTLQMWENIMRRLEAENEFAEVKVEFDRRKLLAFAAQHYKRRQSSETTFNGRQIRNGFQTALALGHADRRAALREAGKTPEWAAKSGKKKWMTVKLTTKNFRSIARTTKEFEDYIVSLRGRDSDAAREAEVRDDDYDPDMGPARKNYGSAAMRAQGGWGRGEGGPTGLTRRGTGGDGGTIGGDRGKRKGKRRDAESEDDDDDDDDDDNDDDDDDAEEDNDNGKKVGLSEDESDGD